MDPASGTKGVAPAPLHLSGPGASKGVKIEPTLANSAWKTRDGLEKILAAEEDVVAFIQRKEAAKQYKDLPGPNGTTVRLYWAPFPAPSCTAKKASPTMPIAPPKAKAEY